MGTWSSESGRGPGRRTPATSPGRGAISGSCSGFGGKSAKPIRGLEGVVDVVPDFVQPQRQGARSS
jgi:hypothetical protein